MLFCALSCAFGLNMFLLQPESHRWSAAVRGAQPAGGATILGSLIEEGSDIRTTGSIPSPTAAAGTGSGMRSQDLVRAIQRELRSRGYDTGAADGVSGLVTRAAIMAFESDSNLPLTGEASETLLQFIVLGIPQGRAEELRRASGVPAHHAVEVTRTVQSALAKLGYQPGAADGRMSAATARAIREFEVAQGLPETGRISGQLAARLMRLSASGRMAEGR